MKPTLVVILALALFLSLTASAFAQRSTSLQELKDAIAAQQQQIQQLQQQVQSRDAAIQQLQQQVGQAQAAATDAQKAAAAAALAQAPKSEEEITGLQHDVTDLKACCASTTEALQETQKRVSDLESPLAIHYKGVTLTPGGFFAGETVWRSHATLGGINTQLNGIPFSASGQARQSEFYGSGRQSQINMLVQGKLANMNLTGYYEMDLLAAGVTSNNNQSNSYVLRQRQFYAQAALHSGYTFTGGQMWSLVTETKVGLDNRTEARPMTIDPQYTVGFSWARQYAFRVTKNVGNKAWLGVSVENSETLLTVSGAPGFSQSPCPSGSTIVSAPVTPTNPTGTAVSCPSSFNFLIGGVGNLGGLYNNQANYSSNVSPDFVAKLAFQPGFGHYEIYGVASSFRGRIYPNASLLTTGASNAAAAVGAFNNTIWGGGVGANARWLALQKKLELGIHYLGGNGVGRYGTSTLPDATVYSNGSEHLLRSYQGLGSIELHLPKWDYYFYGGVEYAGKNSDAPINSKGVPVPTGYGSPLFNNTGCGKETLPNLNNGFGPGSLGSCVGNTRLVAQGTAGFWYKPYNGPKGRLQMGLQYSYLSRTAWVGYGVPPFKGLPGSSTLEPTAINNMWFTSFRYYLP